MYVTSSSGSGLLSAFHMSAVAMRYSQFMPRLYNLAISHGFERGKIMPSRAFCSDESQGYPIILMTQHFATFPFNHGLVGGVVATDRHGPYAHHGKDLVIIQASHVGFDPESQDYGVYRRLQTEEKNQTSNCGKICGTLDVYINEYNFARNNIFLRIDEKGEKQIIIDNSLLDTDREQGLFIKQNKILDMDAEGSPIVFGGLSTSKIFKATAALINYLDIQSGGSYQWKNGNGEVIGDKLHPDLFYYNRTISHQDEGHDHLEHNLVDVMPYIVTSKWPALTAAQINTQVEYDRTFRTIVQEPAYKGKKIMFISGLNVDISPSEGQLFPLTKFIPWAGYLQNADGSHEMWEQAELFEKLKQQSVENPNKVNLELAIKEMEKVQEIRLPL